MSRRFVQACINSCEDVYRAVNQLEQFSSEDAVRSYWQTSPRVSIRYLVYRWIQFLFHFTSQIMSFFEIGRRYHEVFQTYNVSNNFKYQCKWLLYLTHWGLIMNTAQSLLGAMIVQKAYISERRLSVQQIATNTPRLVSQFLVEVYTKLFVVSINMSTYITMGFWIWVYNPLDTLIDAVTVSEHGIGMIMMIIDLIVAGIPYKVLYGCYSVLLSLMYLLMTFVHYASGALDRFQENRFLYEKSDWSKPQIVIGYFLTSLAILFSFNISLWSIYLLKRQLRIRLRGNASRTRNV